MNRCGFTLTEIIVSLGIFMLVGGAMVGIFISGTSIYRDAERGRLQNDEIMTIFSAIDDDVRAALPATVGGELRAKAFENGNCYITWRIDPSAASLDATTIENAGVDVFDADTGRLHGDVAIRWDFNASAKTLDRIVEISYEDSSGNRQTAEYSREMARGVEHFGVWLAGFRRNNQTNLNIPDASSWWETLADSKDDCPPVAGGAEFTATDKRTSPNSYPQYMRVSLVTTGEGKFLREGRLAGDISDSDDAIIVRGLSAMSVIPGTVLRIDNEWIGVHARDGDTFVVNDEHDQGPNYHNSGRGVLRTLADSHKVGASVIAGQLHSTVFRLPGR